MYNISIELEAHFETTQSQASLILYPKVVELTCQLRWWSSQPTEWVHSS